MDILSSPIPQISISLAPPEEIPAEPFSPFATASFSQSHDEDDGFRPLHLTPPPTNTSFPRRPHSPLARSADSPAERPKQTGKGLDQARFAALLNATKEKPAVKKDVSDLRKEVALKAHQSKQAGRRALFLSKVLAPPSPTAAVTPKTPPESPAIFHYSLPSPGLVSPLTHYESLHDKDRASADLCEPWVEQVDFKVMNKLPPPPQRQRPRQRATLPTKPRQPLPSLEQISARLIQRVRPVALPVRNDKVVQSAPVIVAPEAQPRLVVGRLRMPVRKCTTPTPIIKISLFCDDDSSSSEEEHDEQQQKPHHQQATLAQIRSAPVAHRQLPPKSPLLTTPLDLEVTTLAVSRSQNVSPTELTRANLQALNSRESRSSAMLSTLRRRTQSTTLATAGGGASHLRVQQLDLDDPTRKAFRRHSAPPESMDIAKRVGFEHPVLRLPGAF